MNEKDTIYAKWLNGELDASELEALRKSGELGELEAIINVADDMVLPKYDLEEAFQKFKSNHPPRTAKIVAMRAKWAIGIAASLVLLAAAWFLFGSGETQIVADNQETATHTFRDRTSVVLNDGSNFVYDKNNWEKQRMVQLTGEAYFEVKTGTSFIVETANGKVEVLGTGFNVRAWGDKLHVECYHGKVRVTAAGQETVLTKNEAVNVVKGKMENKSTISHASPLWSTGTSRFYEENVDDVFKELERQFDVIVNAPTLGRPFSGSFQHDDINQALNNICKPLNLNFDVSADGKTVTIE
ncbi:MAG: FecR domain-containing protein [Bacteroidota bacterium]